MRKTTARRFGGRLLLSAIVAIAAGCGGAVGSASSTPEPALSATPTATAVTVTPSPTPSPSPTEQPWSGLSASKPTRLTWPWKYTPSLVEWRGKYVALGPVGGDSDEYISAESTDMAHWTILARGSLAPRAYRLLATPGGPLVAIGWASEGSGTQVWTSMTGATWTPVSDLAWQLREALPETVEAGPKGIVAIVDGGNDAARVLYSLDGSSWTAAQSPDTPLSYDQGFVFHGVTALPGGFIVTERGPLGWFAWWSSDGLTWARVSIDAGAGFEMVDFAAGGMLGWNWSGGLWRSSDGLTWTSVAAAQVPWPVSDNGGVTYFGDGKRLIALARGNGNSILAWESFDAATWRALTVAGGAAALDLLGGIVDGWAGIVYAEFSPAGVTVFVAEFQPVMSTLPDTFSVLRLTATP